MYHFSAMREVPRRHELGDERSVFLTLQDLPLVMCVILREPSERRPVWTIILIALASWTFIAVSGISTSLIIAIVSRRVIVSLGYVAWTVERQPP